MTTTAFNDSPTSVAVSDLAHASSLLGTPAGELVLRMTAGPHVGRVVRLSAAKCSIGSSADCTLRLRGRGIEPLHCLILRGAEQTIIRRWSSDTRLNDRPFDDAPLVGGDRLSVGPLEFQVLAAPERLRETTVGKPRRPEVELAAALERIERLTERLDLANRQGRRRLRSVIARLRKYQLRLNDLEGRRSQLAQEREQLQAERTRLTEQAADLQRRADELHRRTEAAADDVRARDEQAALSLQARESELAARAKTLDERLAAVEAGQRKLAEREAECVARGEELRRRADECEGRESAANMTAAELKQREERLVAADAELKLREERWGAGSAELRAREDRLAADAAALELRRERAAADAAELKLHRELLTADAADLQRREAALAAATETLQRNEADVAARCQALKNHWAELVERESRLERDREALNRRERESAEAPPPAIQAEPEEENQAAEAREETRRLLEQEREALDRIRDACEQRQVALDERQAELARRRETLELAARVLDRRAQLVETEAASLAEQAATPPAEPTPPEPAVDAEQGVADRLRIEHLEAQVQTWRDEAKHWKHQFDELHLRDALKGAVPTTVVEQPNAVAAEPESIEEPAVGEASQAVAAPEDAAVDVAPQAELESAVREDGPVVAEPIDEAAPGVVDEDVVEATDERLSEPVKETPQSESAADVLRRLGMTPETDGEEPAAPPPPPAAVSPKPAAVEHHEPEESLDVYMQQLFQRLGVKQGAAPAAAASPSPTTTRTPVADPQVEAAAEKSVAPPAPVVPLTAEEFKARSVAAERKSDLSALRELANVSAKTAIAKHQVKTQSNKSKWKLLTALGSLAVAGVSGWAYLIQGYDWGKYGVVAGAAIAVLSMLQSFGAKYRAAKSARSLDDVLQKSMSRAPTKEAVE